MVGVPWPERTNVTLFPTDSVFPLSESYSPALDRSPRAFTDGDCSDIGIRTGLDHIVEPDFLSEQPEGKLVLLCNIPAGDLDLHDIGYLLWHTGHGCRLCVRNRVDLCHQVCGKGVCTFLLCRCTVVVLGHGHPAGELAVHRFCPDLRERMSAVG